MFTSLATSLIYLMIPFAQKIKPNYRPKEKIYYTNDRVKRVINTLVDGTFNDGDTGMFGEPFSQPASSTISTFAPS